MTAVPGFVRPAVTETSRSSRTCFRPVLEECRLPASALVLALADELEVAVEALETRRAHGGRDLPLQRRLGLVTGPALAFWTVLGEASGMTPSSSPLPQAVMANEIADSTNVDRRAEYFLDAMSPLASVLFPSLLLVKITIRAQADHVPILTGTRFSPG